MYRLGWYFATFLAKKLAIPLLIQVKIRYDGEANVYIATSSDLKGLVVEAETLDELEKEVFELVPELLALNNSNVHVQTATHLSFIQLPIAI
jgi:predicted RNase H-like HicB family nuclease